MSLIISKKHGVNPAMMLCPICGGDSGLALLGRLKNDAKAPRRMVGNPCDQCIEFMKKGIIVVSCKDGEPDTRTGKLIVMKDDADLFNTEYLGVEMSKTVKEKRVLIMSDSDWLDLGFPTENITEKEI